MPRVCCVDGCRSRDDVKISSFRFPKDETRCQRWKQALSFVDCHRYANLEAEQCNKKLRVCDRHFSQDNYIRSNSRTNLRYDAVPSLNLLKNTEGKTLREVAVQTDFKTMLPNEDDIKIQDVYVQTEGELFSEKVKIENDVSTQASVVTREAMASTVEQGEIKSLGPLSSTLELFDSFKSQEEDKDSDEESFHIPMLGCDDDNDIETGKEDILESSSPNGETEDDILNKFETGTPEVADVKEEHLLLQGDDDTSKDNIEAKSDQSKKDSETSDNEMLFNDLEIIDEAEESYEETEQKKEDKGEKKIELKNKILDSVKMNLNLNEGDNSESAGEETFKIDDLDALSPDLKSPDVVEKEDIKNVSVETTLTNEENPKIEDKEKDQIDHVKIDTQFSENVESTNENKDSASEDKEIDEMDTKLDNDQAKDDEVEFMELDVQITQNDQVSIEDKISKNNKHVEKVIDFGVGDVTESTDMDTDVVEDDKSVDDKSDIKEGETDRQVGGKKTLEDETAKKMLGDKTEKEKLEDEPEEEKTVEKDANEKVNKDKSKETQANKDEECDDLLDISVIRDADEDNAISDGKSEETEEQDDKQENDVDETEADREDRLASSDKYENMDFDEGNTNSCDQDTSTTDMGVSEHTSDAENKDSEIVQSESDSQHPPSIDDVAEIISNHSFVDNDNKSEDQVADDKEVEAKADNDKAESIEISDDKTKTAEEKPTSPSAGKRPLLESDNESLPVANKKMRMSEESTDGIISSKQEKKKTNAEKKSQEDRKKSISTRNDKMKTLITFEKFMKQRNLGEGKLTRSDLEQFCLQKICEALIHKTDTGELHQTIKKQEQIIDTLRKDIQQLSKQTRDLDIVNKKLMNELRTQNLGQKPLVPLKITRSVGLQVKLNAGNEQTTRRKSHPGPATTPRTPTTPVLPTVLNRQRNIQANNNVVRQVASGTSSTPTRKAPATAPILTQALQTRPSPTPPAATSPAIIKRPPLIRPKTAEPQKPSAPGVIDLTDEDDRTAKNIPQKSLLNKNAANSMKLANKLGGKSTSLKVQSKTLAVGQVKTTQSGTKVGLPTRTVTTLPQGVRLTPAQMKNGIAIPASVVTSTAGGATQLMYVVQPSSTGNSGTGVQKAVLLNFQPATNGVLTSALNGSTVSMIPSKSSNIQLKTLPVTRKHPAPLPLPPPATINASLKPLLPKPHLSIRKTDNGIILQWRMPYNLDIYEGIASYQLFAYQETNAPPSTDMWRKVGDVKALALPMACTLTQFADKNKYYFAVRSVDVHKRIGAFSDPEEISL